MHSPTNLADAKARHASREVLPDTIRVDQVTEDFTTFVAEDSDGHRVMLCTGTLKSNANRRARRGWWSRAVASLTGICPACDGVTGVASVASGTRMDLMTGHADRCPALDCLSAITPRSLAWFDAMQGRGGNRG